MIPAGLFLSIHSSSSAATPKHHCTAPFHSTILYNSPVCSFCTGTNRCGSFVWYSPLASSNRLPRLRFGFFFSQGQQPWKKRLLSGHLNSTGKSMKIPHVRWSFLLNPYFLKENFCHVHPGNIWCQSSSGARQIRIPKLVKAHLVPRLQGEETKQSLKLHTCHRFG